MTIRETILGKVYELVDQTPEELKGSSCEGCAFDFYVDGCMETSTDVCITNESKVWKEVKSV